MNIWIDAQLSPRLARWIIVRGVPVAPMTKPERDLKNSFPEFAAELESLLIAAGEKDLAAEVATLRLVDRCRCGDWFCATVYCAPRPPGAWGPRHKTICLDPSKGMINVDVVDGKVVEIEVLYRDDLRDKLLSLLP